jgi:hypothetical protein
MFLITDDIVKPSCCTIFVYRFLCFADNLSDALVKNGSSPLIHEQTPFRLLIMLISLAVMVWTIALVILMIYVQYL